ncbi:OmpH family outer membrane protein [Tellurirhabdus rosea]|uniref:OmpH family outer membrane protein n=1 Tax=Tellurirhabdus rosea TaxID=2674997 RepID=UPI00225531AB|nr:OmpH family outer membrane protein [Tellurirhabdus rosea]
MKNKLILAALAAGLMVGAGNAQAQAQQPVSAATPAATAIKIGYTNIDYILGNMPESKDIQNQLGIQRTQLENAYNAKVKEFQDKLATYEKGAATMTDVIRADREKELQNLQQQIQEFQRNSEESLQKKYTQLVNPVLQKIQTNIDAVAKENGYTHVFNLDAGTGTTPILLYATKESDITELVFKKMGVTPPSAQPAAAAPAQQGGAANRPAAPAPKTGATTPKKN